VYICRKYHILSRNDSSVTAIKLESNYTSQDHHLILLAKKKKNKVSALADWFPYLKPIPRAWFTYSPDDGGSKDL
jgi:hypothetical protein